MANVDKFRVNYISGASRRIYNTNYFRGVDFNKSELSVADNHLTDMLNLVYRDNAVQKRKGWNQLSSVGTLTYKNYSIDGELSETRTNTKSINGVWKYKDNIIAHIGKCLYISNFEENNFELIKCGKNENSTIEIKDFKSSAFYYNNNIYILGGNYYIVIKSDLKVYYVEDDEDTFIPTTTTGITYSWQELLQDGTVATIQSVSKRQSLDDPNMLTQWRRNKALSGTYVNTATSKRLDWGYKYDLDSNVYAKNDQDKRNIRVTISYIKGN